MRTRASFPTRRFTRVTRSVAVAAANDGLFRRLCAVLHRPDVATDARFATNPDRVANREALVSLVAAEIARRDADELLEALAQAGVPSGKIRDVPDAFAAAAAAGDPATLTVEHPAVGPLELVRTAVRIDDGAARDAAPPRLGEHTREILRDLLGRADSEIDALAASGAIQE
jgi:Predicted acyl-CoA transferases/carnitine dehydratase